MTVRDKIAGAAQIISRRDAETLLGHVLGRERVWLLAHPEAEVEGEVAQVYAHLVQRRALHEPLQYLTGFQEFYGLPFSVSREVLIPRPETEILVGAVLEWAGDRAVEVVDVGTGSGAIALALAAHLANSSRITAVDLSPGALEVARGNAARLGLQCEVRFLQSNLLEELTGPSFDVVASNPPYVNRADEASLDPQVRDYEPHLALFAEQDGLAVYRKLIPQARLRLRAGGLLAMEFGFGQQEALAKLLGDWQEVRFLDDLAAIPRVVLAERP